ncbi:MAG: leucine-rich repeat domain-containing protein [Clostridia bacterium]|nr:leucine-rich repeat domain-containing protein [Clostridia bacterium]
MLFSCVKESPEPIFDPESVSEKDRKIILIDESQGVTYNFYNDNTCEIISYDPENADSTSLILPDMIDGSVVTKIHDNVFSGTAYETVTLPKNLRVLGERAFQKSAVKNIVLPDTLTEIGKECFDNCSNLESVSFGKGLKTIPLGAFYGCKNLKEVILPEGVTKIEEEAFAALSSLEKVSLPESLEEIGPYAFWNSGTDSLSFTIPKKVSKIGKNAFLETRWFHMNSDEFFLVGDGVLLSYKGKETELSLPDEVKHLSNAFDRSGVKTLALPKALESIAENSFEGSKIETIRYEGADKDILSAIKDYQQEDKA